MTKQLLSEVFYRNQFKKNLARPETLALFHFCDNVLDSSRWNQSMWISEETTFIDPPTSDQCKFSSQTCLCVAEPTDPHVLTLSLFPALNMNCFTFELFFASVKPSSFTSVELEILFKSAQNGTILNYQMTGYRVSGPNYNLRYYDAILTDQNNVITPTTTLFHSISGQGAILFPVKTFMLTGLQGVYSAYGLSWRNNSWYILGGKSLVLSSTIPSVCMVDSIEFKVKNLYLQELRILNNVCRLTGDYNSTTNYWTPPRTHYTGSEVYS